MASPKNTKVVAADAAVASADIKIKPMLVEKDTAKVEEFNGYTIKVISRGKFPHSRRMLVRKDDKYFNVYTYDNVIEDCDAKVGMVATLLAELRVTDKEGWWNCTSIIPE